jgi:hypothetical protein
MAGSLRSYVVLNSAQCSARFTLDRQSRHEYGILYGMMKTTVYLPDELKRELERAAEAHGRSEADIIREGIRLAIDKCAPPMPTLWTFTADDPGFIDRIDELLDGFGEQ